MRVEREMPVPCDFTLPSFEEAVMLLGAADDPGKVVVFVSDSCLSEAKEVRDKWACQIEFVPQAFLVTRYAWAVTFGGDAVWSKGT